MLVLQFLGFPQWNDGSLVVYQAQACSTLDISRSSGAALAAWHSMCIVHGIVIPIITILQSLKLSASSVFVIRSNESTRPVYLHAPLSAYRALASKKGHTSVKVAGHENNMPKDNRPDFT